MYLRGFNGPVIRTPRLMLRQLWLTSAGYSRRWWANIKEKPTTTTRQLRRKSAACMQTHVKFCYDADVHGVANRQAIVYRYRRVYELLHAVYSINELQFDDKSH